MAIATVKDVRCITCAKTPEELPEYVEAARRHGSTPTLYVEQEEVTYNPGNGHFLCATDFVRREKALGMPLANPDGSTWTAP